MTAFTGSFELRRVVVKFTRTPAGGISEDAAAFTLHVAKLVAGAIDAGWLAADYAATETRLDTFWTALKGGVSSKYTLSEYRWYKDGPDWSPIDRGDGPPNPSVRTTARAVVATNAASPLPPQLAMTSTLVTEVRKRWGRIYFLPPTQDGSGCDANGRIAGMQVSLHNALLALANGQKADGRPLVVWSRARSHYVSPIGSDIPAHPATAYTVDSIQTDNVFDVMRSRRYKAPTSRLLNALS